ncbi:DUF3102 domain-containing protein [Roseobacter sp. HKCCD9010]|uniref:DUF3102 domain-containing protein n=1 Tax=unclassified Roseobacter TaxID=196798 RepID=UPI001492EB0D|nr:MULTISPECIES: DUF3102 domain-containing protein [unclassified Roseobacter]MBF9050625.1 DUF3102 domain-containing protein [Rhodobacterales bacterium HKCCD4356]NNV11957.1 DUF3102 domain-containing protein [Roseobacter sp. HKCCD7357]NNV16970.1 DUF3102 domain-containing protein [Roseobacter sp. HKCCD8768]NNV26199.1 DUF3102 domain-containing protein [Roseobacter sp. HKCCD8192]NNV30694.1 DUF3102 domain-containing protein [Roseobacter sp. HKCCD9061]
MTEIANYDYAGLAQGEINEVRAAAERIRVRMKRTTEDIVAIGLDLIAVKERLPHGAFLPWIEAEFGMSRPTATRFMQVAEVYRDKVFTLNNLDPTVLYELAAPSTPSEVRDAVEARTEAGEAVTAAEIKRMKREIAEERARADHAETQADDLKDQNRSLLEGQSALIERAKADALAEVAADLSAAQEREEEAEQRLQEETARLVELAENAEVKALEAAQAQADGLANEAYSKLEAQASKAKNEEAAARKSIERLKQNAERLRARVEEHQAYLDDLKNADIEARGLVEDIAALEEKIPDVEAALRVIWSSLQDIDCDHEPSLIKRANAFAEHLRQVAVQMQQVATDLETNIKPEGPKMQVVSGE